MTTQTRIIWTESPAADAIDAESNNKIAEMVSQGKTDGIATWENGIPTVDKKTGIRTFATTDDAQEWVTFLYTLSYLPDSYTIVPTP
jgi:hypothetical protein